MLGLFAGTVCRATVQVPDPVTPNQSASFDLPARVGIAALLDEANAGDNIEEANHGGAGFDAELAQLIERGTAKAAVAVGGGPAAGGIPVLLGSPGDLVALVGIDTQPVAQAMSARTGATIVPATENGPWDRRRAMELRAEGVHDGRCTILTLGPDDSRSLPQIDPDQVWAVVDAGRKPEDTARWVSRLAEQTHVTAVAVCGEDTTSSPHTVQELGLPIGWTSKGPAT